VIAGKAVALAIAGSEEFRERQRRTVAGAQAVARALDAGGDGAKVLTGGTDVHLILVDLRGTDLDGREAQDRLHEVGITVNRNAIPFDPRPPMVTSGLRIGTSALASRGLQVPDFDRLGQLIAAALGPDFSARSAALRQEVETIAERHPLYAYLDPREGIR
jgi:glycine hydroxymethyltransferase